MKEQDQSSILMDISNRISTKLVDLLEDPELNEELANVFVAIGAYSNYILNRPDADSSGGLVTIMAGATLSLAASSLLMGRNGCLRRLQQIYGPEKTRDFLNSYQTSPPAEVTLEMLQGMTKDWNYTPAAMNYGQTIH